MLSGFVPSGFERFFRDFGHSAGLEDVEPLLVREAEIQRLNATASQYDMELVRGPNRTCTRPEPAIRRPNHPTGRPAAWGVPPPRFGSARR